MSQIFFGGVRYPVSDFWGGPRSQIFGEGGPRSQIFGEGHPVSDFQGGVPGLSKGKKF